MVLIVCIYGMSCCQSDKSAKKEFHIDTEESYGDVPTDDTYPDSDYDSPHKVVYKNIPQELIDRIVIKVKYVGENKIEACIPESGKFIIERNADGSEYVKTTIHGTISSGENWEKVFNLQLSAVVDMNNPPSFPYSWEYSIEHYQNPENLAQRYAYNQTILRIYKILFEDGMPYSEETIYPNPNAVDPENVVLEGYTRLLEGSMLSYGDDLKIISESKIYEKDHVGMELEVTYFMNMEEE